MCTSRSRRIRDGKRRVDEPLWKRNGAVLWARHTDVQSKLYEPADPDFLWPPKLTNPDTP